MCGSHAACPSTVSPSARTAGHDRVLGAHDRRLVEVHARAAQRVGRQLVDAVDRDLGAERAERVDVRVETPAADDVAARRRHGDRAEAREQRPARRNDARISRASSASRSVFAHSARVDADLVRAGPLDVRTEVGEELDHRLDVADARDVREPHLLRRERACSEDRKRAVLVARCPHGAAQRTAALDDEGLHRAGNATRGLHGAPGAQPAEVLDLEPRDRTGRLEAEHLRVERELGLERADDVLRLAEPVPLALVEEVRVRNHAPAARATMSSACDGGTTRSSAPWSTSIGVVIRSVKWIGLRSL